MNRMTDWTGAKTSPCRNFVAGGNKFRAKLAAKYILRKTKSEDIAKLNSLATTTLKPKTCDRAFQRRNLLINVV